MCVGIMSCQRKMIDAYVTMPHVFDPQNLLQDCAPMNNLSSLTVAVSFPMNCVLGLILYKFHSNINWYSIKHMFSSFIIQQRRRHHVCYYVSLLDYNVKAFSLL